jgi:predicted Rossmann-fold nucleotide-binding protein
MAAHARRVRMTKGRRDMQEPIRWTLALCVAVGVLTGCATVSPQQVASFDCRSSVANASYTGPYKGVENDLDWKDMAQDLYCANLFKSRKYPDGFVAIYGSSRIGEASQSGDAATRAAHDRLYLGVLRFAAAWTRSYGTRLPILSGAGPGIMEAAHRGASGAGPSIGYTTYYDRDPNGNVRKPYGGDAGKAFWTYQGRPIVTDGLIFSSVAMREYSMILHSAAIVIAPGGSGTEWEAFQILETIKSGQLARVPVFLVGDRALLWKSFYDRLDDMVRRGTVRAGEITSLFVHVDDPEELTPLLKAALKLN